ncbi:MAG: hypothetical protein ACQERN_09160 [Thermodesulfobacteriota bacterium]
MDKPDVKPIAAVKKAPTALSGLSVYGAFGIRRYPHFREKKVLRFFPCLRLPGFARPAGTFYAALVKINWLVAAITFMRLVEFIGKDFIFSAAFRAFACKGA